MSQAKLKEAIDRMVEDSIRRILPQVMNEVLLQTIANAGVVQERRSQSAPRAAQQSQPQPASPARSPGRKPSSLSELLDPQAGADFYEDPRAAMQEATREERPQSPQQRAMAQRIQSLPPAFQQLAEGVTLHDDEGEMWQPGERDSAAASPVASGPPIDRAADALGIDFTRMSQVAKRTSPAPMRESVEDRMAKAEFEQARLARKRESLNKPVG